MRIEEQGQEIKPHEASHLGYKKTHINIHFYSFSLTGGIPILKKQSPQ